MCAYVHARAHTLHAHVRTHAHTLYTQKQVEKLQAKFEVMNKKHQGGPEEVGPDGQPFTQAYYVIKAAQEREELQREVCVRVRLPPVNSCMGP